MQFYEKHLDISSEIRDALLYNRPVVALESTTISHGMPYPQNVQTAMRVEEIIRENGAIPATIAILNGKLKVGLTSEEIDYIGRTGKQMFKTSRRDIPFIVSKRLDGSTTVASSIIVASFAGINVFVTGGTGGVHRGAHETFDISADLKELSHTNIAVISSGIKPILDIALTLEYLETNGVPVIGYQTNEFPSFYSKKNDFKVNYRSDRPVEIAESLKVKWDLGLQGGVLITNPISKDNSINYNLITEAVEKALALGEKNNIRGKELTQFLLENIGEITGGTSYKFDTQLIFNNAKLAAQIAKEYCNIR